MLRWGELCFPPGCRKPLAAGLRRAPRRGPAKSPARNRRSEVSPVFSDQSGCWSWRAGSQGAIGPPASSRKLLGCRRSFDAPRGLSATAGSTSIRTPSRQRESPRGLLEGGTGWPLPATSAGGDKGMPRLHFALGNLPLHVGRQINGDMAWAICLPATGCVGEQPRQRQVKPIADEAAARSRHTRSSSADRREAGPRRASRAPRWPAAGSYSPPPHSRGNADRTSGPASARSDRHNRRPATLLLGRRAVDESGPHTGLSSPARKQAESGTRCPSRGVVKALADESAGIEQEPVPRFREWPPGGLRIGRVLGCVLPRSTTRCRIRGDNCCVRSAPGASGLVRRHPGDFLANQSSGHRH